MRSFVFLFFFLAVLPVFASFPSQAATKTPFQTNTSASSPTVPFINAGAATDGTSSTALGFQVNGTEYMRLTATGSVGIGTASPLSKITIFDSDKAVMTAQDAFGGQFSGTAYGGGVFGSNLYISTTSLIDLRTAGTHASYGYSGIMANNGRLRFFTASGATTKDATVTPTTRLYIETNGNVGIGTTSPTTQLQITNANNYGSLMLGNNGGDNNITFTHESDGSFGVWNGTFGSGKSLLRITSSGNMQAAGTLKSGHNRYNVSISTLNSLNGYCDSNMVVNITSWAGCVSACDTYCENNGYSGGTVVESTPTCLCSP